MQREKRLGIECTHDEPERTLCKVPIYLDIRRTRPPHQGTRKCADTIGTVLVPWAGHFHCQNINIFFKYNIHDVTVSMVTTRTPSRGYNTI